MSASRNLPTIGIFWVIYLALGGYGFLPKLVQAIFSVDQM